MRMYARFEFERKKNLTKSRLWRFPQPMKVLRKQSADESGLGDATDGENHGAGARRHVMLAHGVHHFVEGTHHDLPQALVYFLAIPEEAFLVLHPLEIADRDTAGVGQDVWENGDAAPGEDLVGMRGGGAVRGFRDDAGLDGFGVVQRNHVVESRRDENVALHGKQVFVRDARSAGHADNGARALLVANGLDGINAARVRD